MFGATSMAIADVFRAFPRLATERLVLREMTLDDTDAVFALYSDDAVMQYLDIGTLTTPQQAADIVQFYMDRFRKQIAIRWAISLHGAPQLIGTCGFHPFDQEHNRVEIGYDLLPAYWERGFMTEALQAMLHYGFTTLELHRVEAVTAPDNAASRRLLAKLGFREEGILRQRSLFRGRYVDDVYFGLLHADAHPPA
jgi:ribosomal-protein-alanine N-acetyltransferase